MWKYITMSHILRAALMMTIIILKVSCEEPLPTLYEYYTAGGINSTLEAPASGFLLNGKKITVFSGAIHYFRVHPQYWQDRMRKLRAAGFNTLETYLPWNLHEPERDVFDFGDGNQDFSMFLDVRKFIQLAQEEDLFIIIRPGPYICSEWDFGGLPSWLLRIPNIKVRTSDPQFTSRVKIYFDALLPLLSDLQFTRGGPIIAVQIENEYGGFGKTTDPRDKDYLRFIKKSFEDNGLQGLFFTSDTPSTSGDIGSLPGVFEDYLEEILTYNASINIYMFHGGTSFGFMNGANAIFLFPHYAPDTSSYDYDAPLSEAGDYTEKYRILERVVAKYNQVLTKIPEKPEETTKSAYGAIKFSTYMNIEDILNEIMEEDKTRLDTLQSMECLPVNNGNGQSYGYINYQKKVVLSANSTLKISGHVRDIALLILDNQQRTKIPANRNDLHGFGFWPDEDQEFVFEEADAGEHTLDILVENAGRVNYGNPEDFVQKKGLWEGPVTIDGAELTGWEASALQFKSQWLRTLSGWKQGEPVPVSGPVLLRSTFEVEGVPADTWLDFSLWGKGIAFVNGFHLGRYFNVGPPKTLYVPGPLLKTGTNEVIVFEHYKTAAELTFRDSPIFNT